MKISRRDFLKWSVAAAAALKLNFDIDKLNTVMAADTDPPVIWLQGASCTGCSISTLNVTTPATIDTVLTSKVSMKYHPDLSTFSGMSAIQAIDNAASQYNGQFILAIEGAVHTGKYRKYCVIGENNGKAVTMYDAVMKYGPMAKYVVAVGTCASFGGVARAGVNKATCASVKPLLSGLTKNPVVNIAGCPAHPTAIVQTLLDLILTGVPAVDSNNRPTKYFSARVHSRCPREESDSDASRPGVFGCYEGIGCRGPRCNSNLCPSSSWNNNRGWCIGVNHPCIGCTDPTFPTTPVSGRNAVADTDVPYNTESDPYPDPTVSAMYGDLTGDGNVDAIDYANMKKNVLNGQTPPELVKVSDLNGDGDVNSLDLALFKQKLLGLINKFPVE